MKSSLFFVFLAFSTVIYGQTDSLEKAVFYERVQNKQMTEGDFASIGTRWNQTIRKIGQYPDLPLDQAGAVHPEIEVQVVLHNK